MYKLFVYTLAIAILSSCGSKQTEMKHNEIYDIIATSDGVIAGLNYGDQASHVEEKVPSLNSTIVLYDSDVTYSSFKIDYAEVGIKFRLECLFDSQGLSRIEVFIEDFDINLSSLEKLHADLVDFFNSKYPGTYEYVPSEDYAGQSNWKLSDPERGLNMTDLDKVAKSHSFYITAF